MAEAKSKVTANAAPASSATSEATSAESPAKEEATQNFVTNSRGQRWPHLKTVRDGRGIVWDYYTEAKTIRGPHGGPPETAYLVKREPRRDTIPKGSHTKPEEIPFK